MWRGKQTACITQWCLVALGRHACFISFVRGVLVPGGSLHRLMHELDRNKELLEMLELPGISGACQ